MTQRAPVALALLTALAVFALWQGLAFVDAGRFVYPIDDVFIHMAIAEQIAQGNYGVNAGEVSSPGSSPLYPLLLWPLPGLQVWLPVLWNAAALVAAAWLWGQILVSAGLGAKPVGWAMAVLGPLAVNLPGLAFTGMEHTLHLTASLAILLGLARFEDSRRVGVLLTLGVLFAPLLRLEGTAFALAAAARVVIGGQPGRGLGLAALATVPLAGFALFLTSLGLDPVPNSVQAKIAGYFVPDMPLPMRMYVNIIFLAHEREGPFVFAGAALPFLLLLVVPALRRYWAFAVAVGLAGLAHVLLGQVGWMSRYEPYILAITLGGATWLAGRAYARAPWAMMVVVIGATILSYYYVTRVARDHVIQAKAVDIRQMQIARLAKEVLGAPVAVNDLGAVSWQNPKYVLDLWGLASAEALDLRRRATAPGWADAMVARHQIDLAVIFPEWYLQFPGTGWVRLGQIGYSDAARPPNFQPPLTLYATSPEAAARLRPALAAWAEDLPAGAAFRADPG